MKKLLSSLVAALFFVAALAAGTASAEVASPDWENGEITVEGYGVAPTNARSFAQGKILARRAALADAYRNIAESIEGVNVDGQTTVENAMVSSDVIKTKVSALVKGARILDEHYDNDGTYTVKMSAPLYGIGNSVASAVFDNSQKPVAFPAPVTVPTTPTIPTVSSQPVPVTPSIPTTTSHYTGLVVDCRGLGLKAVMSPRVKNTSGQVIYGIMNVDPDWVIAHGMASYVTDISRASRAGSNPLVVRAVSLDGFDANPVLSIDDANRVLVENAATGFLDKTNVVFLR